VEQYPGSGDRARKTKKEKEEIREGTVFKSTLDNPWRGRRVCGKRNVFKKERGLDQDLYEEKKNGVRNDHGATENWPEGRGIRTKSADIGDRKRKDQKGVVG